MTILGVSGLERAVPFKRRHWPGLDERQYRISQGHDAAAVLVREGRIVAGSAGERFDRKKHSADFPAAAAAWCLREAGICPKDLDEIVLGFDYEPFREVYQMDPITARFFDEVLSKDAFTQLVRRNLPEFPLERIYTVSHHLAHAASAYYTSGWDECLVIVIDAMGESHGVTVFEGKNGQLTRLRAYSAQDSIGIFYSLLTYHLGFDFNADEYKIMGLAPYGNRDRYREFFEREVILRKDGSIRIPSLRLNRTRDERENYLATQNYLSENLIAPRNPEIEISDQHRDIAAALQGCLDRVLLHICGSHGLKTRHTRLAMAGGVALNCTANGHLMQSGLFSEVYVQPAAGDDGAALGAALYRSAQVGKVINSRCPVPFFGPLYEESCIREALTRAGNQVRVIPLGTLERTCAAAADLIARGSVIGWYRGRMEFGPRALGNRSILADPGDPNMRDRINAMVKKREAFRPFAPAVTIEQVHQWFDVAPGSEYPYMIAVVNVREEWRASLPAITHVNGSARVQTVSEAANPDFHALLKAIGRVTGREIALNTSFNVKGQPIVNTPQDAVNTFLGTGIDCLFLENYLVTRPD